jgi:hypothetical protein
MVEERSCTYLRHLVPPTIQSTTIYPLRNGDNLIVPFCRLSITNSSFIPPQLKNGINLTKNNWSFLRYMYLRSDSVSQPVSAYKYSDFEKWVNLLQFWQRLIEVFLICLNSQFHNYLRLHKRMIF